MSFPARSDVSLVALQLVAFPFTGCGIAVALFTLVIRPRLGWEPWLLDAAAVVCAAGGILLGGSLAFRLSSVRMRLSRQAVVARAVITSTVAIPLTIVLIGSPSAVLTTFAIAGFVALGWLAIVLRSRRHTR